MNSKKKNNKLNTLKEDNRKDHEQVRKQTNNNTKE